MKIKSPTDILLESSDYKWKGGMPLPNGYVILDEDGAVLSLYHSQNQARIHMALSKLIQLALGKAIGDFKQPVVLIIKEYLDIENHTFVKPKPKVPD